MGYNTTVLILNDAWHIIKEHPEEFVAGIDEKMHRGGTFGVGNHCNPVQVIQTEHADTFRLYASHGNQITELSKWSAATKEQIERYPDHLRRDIENARWHLDMLEEALDNADNG